MQDEIIAVYEKEEEINKIVEKIKIFNFDYLIKTSHFEYSILEKGIDVQLLKNKFSEFERIKIITKRQHKVSNISYDFYYELDDGSYILYALYLEEAKPKLLNAFRVHRNFKRFKQKLVNAYKDKLI